MIENQQTVAEWVRETFPGWPGAKGRALAVVEEAVELALAAGLSWEQIQSAVNLSVRQAQRRAKFSFPPENEVIDNHSCPFCGMPKGKKCVSRASSKISPIIHSARWQASKIETSVQEDDRGEVADTLLNLYAYAEERGFDIHEAFNAKMAINRTRPIEQYREKTRLKCQLGLQIPCTK